MRGRPVLWVLLMNDWRHWSADPTDDESWNNYARGWDAGYADRARGRLPRDLSQHGEPFGDGYGDGWAHQAVTS